MTIDDCNVMTIELNPSHRPGKFPREVEVKVALQTSEEGFAVNLLALSKLSDAGRATENYGL